VSPVRASGEVDAEVLSGWPARPASRQSVELYELCRRGDWATAIAAL